MFSILHIKYYTVERKKTSFSRVVLRRQWTFQILCDRRLTIRAKADLYAYCARPRMLSRNTIGGKLWPRESQCKFHVAIAGDKVDV